jgi:hypothetical protein
VAEIRVRAFVDRIEGDLASLLVGEAAREVHWPLSDLPKAVAEGDVLSVVIDLDIAAGKDAGDEIDSLINRLKRGD